jgi:hypothetical protein
MFGAANPPEQAGEAAMVNNAANPQAIAYRNCVMFMGWILLFCRNSFREIRATARIAFGRESRHRRRNGSETQRDKTDPFTGFVRLSIPRPEAHGNSPGTISVDIPIADNTRAL